MGLYLISHCAVPFSHVCETKAVSQQIAEGRRVEMGVDVEDGRIFYRVFNERLDFAQGVFAQVQASGRSVGRAGSEERG